MKKITLSIPKPCHENWQQMTPEDKGRFCGSCQKTVIDFSSMSDRQLAAFFKKPPANVCGRFQHDQLDRALAVPRKRIPWFKYIFHVTWPAMVLLLKSCGLRGEVKGNVATETVREREPDHLLGDTVAAIEPVDTMLTQVDAVPRPRQQFSEPQPMPTLVGEVAVVAPEDSLKAQPDTTVIDNITLDTIVMTRSYTMGMIARIPAITSAAAEKAEKRPAASCTEEKMLAYPNPAHAGGQVTLSLPFELKKGQIALVSSSGQLSGILPFERREGNSVTVQIPAQALAGAYFLQVNNGKMQSAAKIIIIN